ncbi:hypothetical protein ACO2Q8_07850 [Larkinella sp. VNQ87]|uniref:hypothetical protein n=1 Tax=Larkinella sp. VNQ87 TaxID=3400921 RepID=UPI003C0E72A8
MKPILILLVLAVTGCTTFNKAFRKFGHMGNDTTLVQIPVTVNIPKDSAMLVLKTDTTRVIREVRQGRATVRIIRDHTNTIVQANCDSIIKTITGKARVVTKKVTWGVDPKYRSQAKVWRIGAISLALLNVLAIGGWLLLKNFHFTVTRK